MSVAELPIAIDRHKLETFCREHGIRKLSLFGSVLRADFDPALSDLDVLVEFSPGRTPGWEFFGWSEDLALIVGRKVDLHTPKSLSQYFRAKVLQEALPIYEQA